MAYCTQTDLELAIGGAPALQWLTDLTNTAIDTDAVEEAIVWSSSIIDAYATGTPGTGTIAGDLWSPSTPLQAKHTCVTLSIYRLYVTVRREVPEKWLQEYNAAIRDLTMLRDGRVSWVSTIPPAIQALSQVLFRSSSAAPNTGTFRYAKRSQTSGL